MQLSFSEKSCATNKSIHLKDPLQNVSDLLLRHKLEINSGASWLNVYFTRIAVR